MASKEPTFTIGVEEEYLLVDKETRGLVVEPPETLMAEAEEECGTQVTAELLRSQIEVGTKVCNNVQEAHEDLAKLRSSIIKVANRHGLAPIAASTHPFSRWTEQKHTRKERYDSLTHEMQGAARRLVICGMHVHVGIDDDELRIDLMNQLSYFLPHLLALSCSSPFWLGEDTGLKSYRLTIFDAIATSGLPERFASYAEYERHVGILIERRNHRGFHAYLVGSSAERAIPDAGDAHHGRVHAPRRYRRARGAPAAASCVCFIGCERATSAGAFTRPC